MSPVVKQLRILKVMGVESFQVEDFCEGCNEEPRSCRCAELDALIAQQEEGPIESPRTPPRSTTPGLVAPDEVSTTVRPTVQLRNPLTGEIDPQGLPELMAVSSRTRVPETKEGETTMCLLRVHPRFRVGCWFPRVQASRQRALVLLLGALRRSSTRGQRGQH